MKKVFLLSWLLVVTSFPAHADSLVRVQCEDADAGAEIFLNGKFVGECPVDAPVSEGTVQLRARKRVDDSHEQLFEKTLRVVDGVAQRVEVTLSAPQLTGEAKLKAQAAEADRELDAAQAGDIDAMKNMVQRYQAGTGVPQDPVQAKFWREKAETSAAQIDLTAATSGDVEAMRKVSLRYQNGVGVTKDPSLAKIWRMKAEDTARENAEREAAAKRKEQALLKQQRLDAAGPFKGVKVYFTELFPPNEIKNIPVMISSIPTLVLFSVLPDLTSLPTDLTERAKILNEATLRPSTWGKPDSMIAKALLQQEARHAGVEKLLLVADAK